jgi:hypothetical protein
VAFLFDSDLLTAEQAQQRMRLRPDELVAWQFAGPDEWNDLVHAHVARRLDACLRAQVSGSTVYLGAMTTGQCAYLTHS